MILAAGRGERMRPLTDHTPKPLLKAGGKTLIEWQIDRLVAAGIQHIVINHAHLGDQIETYLGDGKDYGVSIQYSVEEKALETGGGIFKALHLLGDAPFLVVNSDIWCDAHLSGMSLAAGDLAHLLLVANPAHHPSGDFALEHGRVFAEGKPKLTFSGVGIYHPDLFAACEPGAFPLAPLLRKAMQERRVSGQYHAGAWMDIGTPQRLEELNQLLRH